MDNLCHCTACRVVGQSPLRNDPPHSKPACASTCRPVHTPCSVPCRIERPICLGVPAIRRLSSILESVLHAPCTATCSIFLSPRPCSMGQRHFANVPKKRGAAIRNGCGSTGGPSVSSDDLTQRCLCIQSGNPNWRLCTPAHRRFPTRRKTACTCKKPCCARCWGPNPFCRLLQRKILCVTEKGAAQTAPFSLLFIPLCLHGSDAASPSN